MPIATGKPLVQEFDRQGWPTRIDNQKEVEDKAGMYPPDKRENMFEAWGASRLGFHREPERKRPTRCGPRRS